MLSFKKFISEDQWGVDNKYMKHSVEKLRSMKDKLETTIGNLKRQHSTKTSLGGKNPRAEEIKELENNLRMLRSAMQAKMRKEEVELDEGNLDKSSPIYKEYEALKKKPVADLRNIIGRSHRVADLKGYDKSGAIRQILDDRYGEKKVDAFFGFSE